MINTTYSESKAFVSTVSLEDLVMQINQYCKDKSKEIEGISHTAVEMEGSHGLRPTPDSAPIYNRVLVFSAIIYYTNRH